MQVERGSVYNATRKQVVNFSNNFSCLFVCLFSSAMPSFFFSYRIGTCLLRDRLDPTPLPCSFG